MYGVDIHLRLWLCASLVSTACGMSWRGIEGKWTYDPKKATCTECLEEWRDIVAQKEKGDASSFPK